jgi:hypothetical protein
VVRADRRCVLLSCAALVGALVAVTIAVAQGPPHSDGNNGGGPHDDGQHDGDHHGGGEHDGRRPVYQRHAFDWGRGGHDGRRNGFDRFRPFVTPQVSSAWFQRPYPYHLDYYKMRWGGSYAPYFGNLYGTPFGTPQVVYGGWGPEGGYPAQGGYPPPGYEWMGPWQYPNGYPPGAAFEQQAPNAESNQQGGAEQKKSEALPAPSK